MLSIASLTVALALTATVIANPIDNRKGFSVQQIQRRIFAKNGPRDFVKTLRKYGKPVPEDLLKASDEGPCDMIFADSADDDGSVPAVPGDEYDSEYLTPVTVGDKEPVTLQLDFDTGSSDLWVYSSLQVTQQSDGHDFYRVDPSKKIEGATWSIRYGDNSGASGLVYAEKVLIGNNLIDGQAVEAASTVSTAFTRDKEIDGILGLGFSSNNNIKPNPQITFFDNLYQYLPSPVFAATLKYHAAGSYDFGFIDSNKYTGEITYTNVDPSKGWWQFSFSGYGIGSEATTEATINGIPDTGTTLLYLPTAIVKEYYARVNGSFRSPQYGGWVFPCSVTTPPDFSLVLNGVSQRVPGQYINYSPALPGSEICYGGIQENTAIGFSIFGDIFLKSKYVVFEQGQTPRVGFADQSGY